MIEDGEVERNKKIWSYKTLFQKITIEPVFFLSFLADYLVGYLNTEIAMNRVRYSLYHTC